MTYYKILQEGRSCHGGTMAWSLPSRSNDGTWMPGEWHEVDGPLVLCQRGLHVTMSPVQWWHGPGGECYVVEVDGELVHGPAMGHKSVACRVRLLRRLDVDELRALRVCLDGEAAYDDGLVYAGGTAWVTARGTAHVVAHDQAHVEAYGTARVDAWDKARVTARGDAIVTASDRARVTAYDRARVTAFHAVRVVTRGMARVTIWNEAHVEAYDETHVEAYGRATVEAWNEATVKVWNEATVNRRDQGAP